MNNIDIAKTYIKAVQTGDQATLGSLIAADVIWHQPGNNQFSGTHIGMAQVGPMLGRMMEVSKGTFAITRADHYMANGDWVAITLIYWCIALPQRVGIAAGLLLGVGLDVLEGSVLGQNAFALVVVALLSRMLYQRMRVYSLWQQAGVVFILVGINQLICQWVQNIEGVSVLPRLFLLPALSSALFWPVVLHSLRNLRRYYQVS